MQSIFYKSNFKIHVLQIYVLQILILQIQSML